MYIQSIQTKCCEYVASAFLNSAANRNDDSYESQRSIDSSNWIVGEAASDFATGVYIDIHDCGKIARPTKPTIQGRRVYEGNTPCLLLNRPPKM